MRVFVFIILLLAQIPHCGAQAVHETAASPDIEANPSPTLIGIVGFVPEFLKLSLNFSPDNKVLLVGYYPTPSGVKEESPHLTGLEFTIRSESSIELGDAILVSNVDESHTISVVSTNGGYLRATEKTEVSIGYSLTVGDQTTRAENGIFRFTRTGKSHKGGILLKVWLTLDECKSNLPHVMYTDELSFNVIAD